MNESNMLLYSYFLEVIVALDASDEFLKSRVMNLPESIVAGTHNTEEGIYRSESSSKNK